MSHAASSPGSVDPYIETQQTPEFQELRSTHRKFILPWTIFFLVWYLTYVLMAAYAKDFMGKEVIGNINIGLIFGLLQFVTTFMITILYMRWANRTLDPKADIVRDHIEGLAPTSAPRQGLDLPEVLDGAFDDEEPRR